jgi:uncharacterized protein YqjF (DUF2071 family)
MLNDGEMKVMTQQWQDLLFAHWAYEPEVVQRLLPSGVELDTFEGKAYVGLVPFNMRNLRLRGLPPIPTTSNFGEVNVRTYVTSRGRSAVWFFSLDTQKLLPTLVARTAFKLPYCYGTTSVTLTGVGEGAILTSNVARKWPHHSSSAIAVRIGESVQPGPVENFLTSRWGLVSSSRGDRLWYGAVEHEPWPLHRAELLHLDDNLVTAAGLPRPVGEPDLLFSPGVHTTIHSLERLS